MTLNPWMDDAACAGVDPDLFFPAAEDGGVAVREAKQVCGGCPVKAECLDYALVNRELFGVWGGTSEQERKHMRRRRRWAS